ncbi:MULTISPECIES: ABC transporter ATP-binding protein [Rhizobium]|jgi:branched-chain amino acid transport system ATP-binding protein|uniref:ABC transporter ATP-binding protein n=1 Tax=Rhizobium TaxID=379 RepID=UPI00041571AF|nr:MULTISPECIES: ABC transporter ATP-binding protein [Rhizobium]KAF5882443.1 ABC transporter ATP-binding protein [Rhizobium sp. PEPV16]NEH59086.1 ATP-binding cassette domain-containing protein [Rhizobium leguminosarum]NKL06476.1 ATP-binding cassette domain-containing protein [Rhizobium leguminosarum bv. viciae]NKL87574.1 ATP-binding cassette domain-containing protein [Rhizobium leguminosarum bv. viciae]NKL92601.1 ATP-binding cassette domain-containing protein [Rhizobium leguminosarum bv. vicia
MTALLRIDRLVSGYGEARVLGGVSFELDEGRSLSLLGRNGAGKTTLVDTIIGVTTHHSGTISFAGADLTRTRPERRAAAGIGWVPQERNIFRSLTVEENLTAIARPGPWSVERVYSMFPRLKERRFNRGNQLSGGEQQMLALGRALMLNPRLLLLDEPLEGLAPIIVDELLAALRKIIDGEGMSAIIIEQKARKILPLTDRTVVLERGLVSYAGESAPLLADSQMFDRYLALGDHKAANPI